MKTLKKLCPTLCVDFEFFVRFQKPAVPEEIFFKKHFFLTYHPPSLRLQLRAYMSHDANAPQATCPSRVLASQKKLGSVATLGRKYEFLKTYLCKVAVPLPKPATEQHIIVLNSL